MAIFVIGRCPRCGSKLRFMPKASKTAGKKLYMCSKPSCDYVKVKN